MPLSGESALRIDANAAIAGQPIKRIRELLRRMGNAHWSHLQIAEFFQIDPTQAIALIGEMVACGFLDDCERRPGEITRFYQCGPQGLRLASARLLKPITRAKAEAIIAAFLQRVESINARPELLERVREVRVFGSYLEERDDLGDVDIAVRTERKEMSGKDWVRESRRRADESGRTFANLIDRIAYGHTEVMRLLKAGNRYLSLHTKDDLEEIGTRSKVLFKDNSDAR
jgi:predicted nucleotidyltransferase